MGINLFYRISLVVNSILSFAFLAAGIVAVFTAPDFPPEAIFFLSFFFVTYTCFLLFNFICFRLIKANKDNQPAAAWLRKYGRPLFIFCCVLIAAIFLLTAAGIVSTLDDRQQVNNRSLTAVSLMILFLFALSGLSMIFNGIAFYKSLRQNKTVVNTVINTIGDSIIAE
ncbi:MAG: hypothetical protein U0V75_15560 [Ferruginibacter sp.]